MSQKVKSRFTFIDTVVEAGSLGYLIGSRLNNAYDLTQSSSILLKFSLGAAKHFVIIESGKRMHSTTYVTDTKERQSPFVIKVSSLYIFYFI